jgi:hypothetical protein
MLRQPSGRIRLRSHGQRTSSLLMVTVPRDRLRYVSGWFCSDPACECQELARPRE